MAGHSKFKNIQNRKNRQDKVKSAKNMYYAKAIYNLARNSNTNSVELRNLIERAKANDVSNDIIDRALKKVNEQQTGEIIYYAAINHPYYVIIKCNMNNKNRFNLIKSTFTRFDFNITSLQSFEHFFNLYTILSIDKNTYNIDDIYELFADYIINIITTEHELILYANVNEFNNINTIVSKENINIEYLSIGYFPMNLVENNNIIDDLINELHEYPEVEEIYTNIEYIPISINI